MDKSIIDNILEKAQTEWKATGKLKASKQRNDFEYPTTTTAHFDKDGKSFKKVKHYGYDDKSQNVHVESSNTFAKQPSRKVIGASADNEKELKNASVKLDLEKAKVDEGKSPYRKRVDRNKRAQDTANSYNFTGDADNVINRNVSRKNHPENYASDAQRGLKSDLRSKHNPIGPGTRLGSSVKQQVKDIKDGAHKSLTFVIDNILEKAIYGVGASHGKVERGSGKDSSKPGTVKRPALSEARKKEIIAASQAKAAGQAERTGLHAQAAKIRAEKPTEDDKIAVQSQKYYESRTKSIDERTTDLVKSLNVDYGPRKSGVKRGGYRQDPDSNLHPKEGEEKDDSNSDTRGPLPSDADNKKLQAGTKNAAIKDGGRRWTAEDKTQKSIDQLLEKAKVDNLVDQFKFKGDKGHETNDYVKRQLRSGRRRGANSDPLTTPISQRYGRGDDNKYDKSLDECTCDLHKGAVKDLWIKQQEAAGKDPSILPGKKDRLKVPLPSDADNKAQVERDRWDAMAVPPGSKSLDSDLEKALVRGGGGKVQIDEKDRAEREDKTKREMKEGKESKLSAGGPGGKAVALGMKSLDERTCDLHKGFSPEKVGGAVGREYVKNPDSDKAKRVAVKFHIRNNNPEAQKKFGEGMIDEIWAHNLKGTKKSQQDVVNTWLADSAYITKGARVVVQGGEPATLVKDGQRPSGRIPTIQQTDEKQRDVDSGKIERKRKAKKRIADLGAE